MLLGNMHRQKSIIRVKITLANAHFIKLMRALSKGERPRYTVC